jgi:hypothetical protein
MTKLIVPVLDEKDLARLAQTVFCAKTHLRKLRDSRHRRGRRYVFVEVVLMALMAMVCGCNDAEEISGVVEELRVFRRDHARVDADQLAHPARPAVR